MARSVNGIALISVLLVLLAVLVLGIATLMLTQGNLLISQNLVGTSIARTNAEAGIDATVAVMRADYEATRELPIHVTAAPTVQLQSAEPQYEFAQPPAWDGNRVTLLVSGFGPRDAEFVSQAVVEFGQLEQSGGSPYTGAIIGCQALHVVGGRHHRQFRLTTRHLPGWQHREQCSRAHGGSRCHDHA